MATKAKPSADANQTSRAAAWVKHVREEIAQLSQMDFAARLGKSAAGKETNRVTISNWENGVFVPEWESVERIARAFPSAPPPPFGPGARSASDPAATVAPPTDQRDLHAQGEKHLRDELERRRPTLDDGVYRQLLDTITSLRGLGPANADAAKHVLSVMLDLYAAGAGRGRSR